MNRVWVTDTYSTATVLFEEMFTGAAFYHISGSFALQLSISKTRLLWSRLGNGKKKKKEKKHNQYFPKFHTSHTTFALFCMARVCNKCTHMIGSFLIFSKPASLSFFFFFSFHLFVCLLWKWAGAFSRIFCTKSHRLKSLAIQPKLLAEQDLVSPFFPLGFLLYPYFLSL